MEEPRFLAEFATLCDRCGIALAVQKMNLQLLEARVLYRMFVQTVPIVPVVDRTLEILSDAPETDLETALTFAVREFQPSVLGEVFGLTR